MFLHSESWTKPHAAPSAFACTRTAKSLKGHISTPSACCGGDTSRHLKEEAVEHSRTVLIHKYFSSLSSQQLICHLLIWFHIHGEVTQNFKNWIT